MCDDLLDHTSTHMVFVGSVGMLLIPKFIFITSVCSTMVVYVITFLYIARAKKYKSIHIHRANGWLAGLLADSFGGRTVLFVGWLPGWVLTKDQDP